MGSDSVWLVSLYKVEIWTQTHVEGKYAKALGKMAICEAKMQASEETNPAGAFIQNFQLSELWEKKFPLYKVSGLSP